ncbi:MAG: hypothetical protein J6P61_04500 [Erysipelotrichaceae bacterium]|nr:hypothetical protein [Erysipelotrichaceae bacterium]
MLFSIKRSITLLLLSLSLILTGCSSSPAAIKKYEAQDIVQKYDGDVEEFLNSEDYLKWLDEYGQSTEASVKLQKKMKHFYTSTLPVLLQADTKKNMVYSPLNIFFALAMLAECAGGETQKQILSLLGVSSTDELKEMVKTLMYANSVDNPVLASKLANSYWLSNEGNYKEDVLNTLVKDYYASSYIGDMKDGAYIKEMKKWLNEHTGDLLKDSVDGLTVDPATIMEIMSAIYYKASWNDGFTTKMTKTFHGANGDTDVEMMMRTGQMDYYADPDFKAVMIPLSHSGSMYCFKVNKGTSIEDLTKNQKVIDLINGSVKADYRRVELTVPKFDVDANIDLTDSLNTLGVVDAFTDQANFKPLTDDAVILSQAEHAARVTVDEQGVTGAAYTIFGIKESSIMIEDVPINFTLDEPFLFVVTGADHSILFSGTIFDL